VALGAFHLLALGLYKVHVLLMLLALRALDVLLPLSEIV